MFDIYSPLGILPIGMAMGEIVQCCLWALTTTWDSDRWISVSRFPHNVDREKIQMVVGNRITILTAKHQLTTCFIWRERMRMTEFGMLNILKWKIQCQWVNHGRHGMRS